MNAVLFGCIAMLHEKRATLGLTGEQMRLLERPLHQSYRAGAGLDESPRSGGPRSTSGPARHLISATTCSATSRTGSWSSARTTARLPGAFVAAAKAAAEERGMAGKAIVTLSRSSVEPFLKSSSRRDLREKVFKAFTARATMATPTTTTPPSWRSSSSARRRQDHGVPDLRRLPAGGFHGQDAGGGAASSERVWKPARARALADRDALQALIAEEGGNFARPWDWRYYAESQRRANFDDAAIKPYLVLDHMIEAAFDCATRLFGITFAERKDIPVGIRTSGSGRSRTPTASTRRCSMAITSPGPRSAPAPG